ncbi:MAG: DUF262 domain-containing protein [Lachnospiraceae bacterium]|nr:DUF262 domain-containing protein [Lachnospiraceae bacterium]
MDNRLILGISKIGDLLLHNKISRNEDGVPIEDVHLSIPEYQRPYKWSAKNANQLLDDIEEAKNDNKEVYRVGTLILHKDDSGRYNIVDGQQRTITFSLILKCLCEEKIDFISEKLSNNTFNLHNVLNNFLSLKRRIERLSDEKEKMDLCDYIENHCELIVVITKDLSEAFQFFDSQNARGKALYPHDLLKAYHLREMRSVSVMETEEIVKTWEEMNQKRLAVLFNDYLYRLKEWVKGNRADELTEHNIDIFKGVTSRDNHPYAQYYKGAFAYANELNHSHVPFVTGIQEISPFQINAPIIAGASFFEYAKHYFDILADIQNNDKYEGYFINDNEIVKTLDLREYKNGVGNHITRLMFDSAILLYVDRFCPAKPSKVDTEYLEQFVIFAFIWAYSMRAQYQNVGWLVAQNYIMGTTNKEEIVNDFNIFKIIVDSDSPQLLLSKLTDFLEPLKLSQVHHKIKEPLGAKKDNVFLNYLDHFKQHKFMEKSNEQENTTT